MTNQPGDVAGLVEPVAWIVLRNGVMYLPFIKDKGDAEHYASRNPDETLTPLYSASTLSALEARIAVLEKALEPFAEVAEPVISDSKGKFDPDEWMARLHKLTIGDFRQAHRAARTALASTTEVKA